MRARDERLKLLVDAVRRVSARDGRGNSGVGGGDNSAEGGGDNSAEGGGDNSAEGGGDNPAVARGEEKEVAGGEAKDGLPQPLNFEEREIVVRADFDDVDEEGCLWVSLHFLKGPRHPRAGETVYLVQPHRRASLAQVQSVNGWLARVKPDPGPGGGAEEGNG